MASLTDDNEVLPRADEICSWEGVTFKLSVNLKFHGLSNHLFALYFVPVREHKIGILILISQQIKVIK